MQSKTIEETAMTQRKLAKSVINRSIPIESCKNMLALETSDSRRKTRAGRRSCRRPAPSLLSGKAAQT